MARKYESRKRAEHKERTRRRIVEAAAALHQTVGPARTTISAIAQRAGVPRLTVYRHFPDERSLYRACMAYGDARWPLPDPGEWKAVADPGSRLRRALDDVYAYYEQTEGITANVLRDVSTTPTLADVTAPFFKGLAEMPAVLAEGWGARGRGRARLLSALALALDFQAWRLLARRQGLDRAEAIDLMVACVAGSVESIGLDHAGPRQARKAARASVGSRFDGV